MKSKTFTYDELWEIVKPSYVGTIEYEISNFLEGKKNSIISFSNQKSKRNEVIGFWLEAYSEEFYEQNPDVDDVLVWMDNGEKEWICSNIQKT